MKSFTFWQSYFDVAQDGTMTEAQQGDFYRAICDYMFLGIDRESELEPIVRVAFKGIKANLKRSISKKRSAVDNDLGRSTSTQNETETPLKLKLNSNLKLKPKPSRRAEEEMSCGTCGERLARNTQSGEIYCPRCMRKFEVV